MGKKIVSVIFRDDFFFCRSADFRGFWTKTIISEIDANPLRSQNAYIGGGGGGTHKLSPNMGGAHIRGQFSAFFISTHSHRAIWFPQSRKTDGICGITSRKRNPIKSNGIGDFLGFFNASTHRPKIYYSLFHPYLTLGSTCGVNVWSVNAQSQYSVIHMFY